MSDFVPVRKISPAARAALIALLGNDGKGMCFLPVIRRSLVERGLAISTGIKHRAVVLSARGRWHALRYLGEDADALVNQ
jgi:hypothetical protein